MATPELKVVNNTSPCEYHVQLEDGARFRIECDFMIFTPSEEPMFVSFIVKTKGGEDTESVALIPLEALRYVYMVKPLENRVKLLG
jgi:hypothetical protein